MLKNRKRIAFTPKWLFGRSEAKTNKTEQGPAPLTRNISMYQLSGKDIGTVNEILAKLQGWSIKFIPTEAGNILLTAMNVAGSEEQMIRCKMYKISHCMYSIARFSLRITKDMNEIELSEFNFDIDINEPRLGQLLLNEMEYQVKIVRNCTLKGSVAIGGREEHYIPFLKGHQYECFIEYKEFGKTLNIQKHFRELIA
jgi:hypothetical protein